MTPGEVTRRLAEALDEQTTVQDTLDGIRDLVACLLLSEGIDPTLFSLAVERRVAELKGPVTNRAILTLTGKVPPIKA